MIKVSKFGGSSAADAAQFRKIRQIVEADPDRRYIVVSAPGRRYKNDSKVTDLLYLMDAHRQYRVDAGSLIPLIRSRFIEIKNELGLKQPIEEELDEFFANFRKMTTADIASRGEYFNAKLLAEYLGYDFVDAKDVIRFHHNRTVDDEITEAQIRTIFEEHENFVFPGFYGANDDGEIVVFPRGGGDITGAILAKYANAEDYENWTDVSGLLMADPGIVKNPLPITRITYGELRELSYMGASVLNDEAVFPAREANIPIHILNTNAPEDPGTIIKEEMSDAGGQIITGIAGKRGFLSIYIYNNHMSGTVGYIRKVLSIVESYNIPVEHIPSGIDSFNLVLNSADTGDSLYEMMGKIQKELHPDKIRVEKDLALVSTVGRNMLNQPGISGRLFSALGKAGINIRMIAQGSDEINITVGVREEDFEQTVRVIYDEFVLREEQ